MRGDTQFMRSRPIHILAAGVIALAATFACGQSPSGPAPAPLAGADTLDFTGRLGRIAPANIFRNEGYYVW